MKHFIISKTQLEWINTMIGETKWNFLGLQKLPELKRLRDEELHVLWEADGHASWNLTPMSFAHAIMDKLGVPE